METIGSVFNYRTREAKEWEDRFYLGAVKHGAAYKVTTNDLANSLPPAFELLVIRFTVQKLLAGR
jgi:hypothetical protein